MSLFIIDDNFLSNSEINEISKKFYDLPAMFTPFTTHPPDGHIPGPTDKYSNRFMYVCSDSENFTNEIAVDILNKFCKKHNIDYNLIYRTRSNTSFLCNDNRPSEPHIDNDKKHLALVYYVNDSDGDTILYKNKYNEKEDNDMLIDIRISPKAGRAVLFDGGIYHSFCYPNIHNMRSVININIGKDKE
jgi:hypothetical protein